MAPPVAEEADLQLHLTTRSSTYTSKGRKPGGNGSKGIIWDAIAVKLDMVVVVVS